MTDAQTPELGTIVTRTLPIEVRGEGDPAIPEVDAEGRRIYRALAYRYEETDTYGTTLARGSMAHVTPEDFRILQYHRADLDPVGKPLSVTETDQGPEVRFVFADTPRAQELRGLVDGGFLRAVSVGFIPLDGFVRADGVTVFTQADLHELSLVNTPASKGALISLARDMNADPADLVGIFGELPEDAPAEACPRCGCGTETEATEVEELRDAIEAPDAELDEALDAWIAETADTAVTVDGSGDRNARLLARVRRHRR